MKIGNKTIELSLQKLVSKKKRKIQSRIEKSGKAVLQAATGASVIIKVATKGALSRVWGMINGIQMIVHVPLFNVKFPESATTITAALIDVATFDIPYFDVISIFGEKNLRNHTEIFKKDIFADNDADKSHLELELDHLGYSSHYLSVCLGSVYLTMVGSILLLILIVLLYPLKNVRQALFVQNKLKSWLCWNFIIRLLLQASLEISFAVLLNIPFMDNLFTSTNLIE